MSDTDIDCELCQGPGGEIVWRDACCRVVLVEGAEGAAFPGFCRVVWNAHVAEISDLPLAQQEHLMKIVRITELALRRLLRPDKINLASLGNMTPHLHWHVIPRWRDDSHFPAPIWAEAQRKAAARSRPARDEVHAALTAVLVEFPDCLSFMAASSP